MWKYTGCLAMTFDDARKSRRRSFWLGCLTLATGFPLLIVSFLKVFYNICVQNGGQPLGLFRNLIFSVYEGFPGISWLWPWMSDTSLESPGSTVMSPTGILGLALTFIGAAFFRNWTRLDKWIAEVKELVSKKEMADTHRPAGNYQQQTTGDVISGGDSNITQQITNHYNQRPDSPKAPIIVALIGAVAVIAAALLHKS